MKKKEILKKINSLSQSSCLKDIKSKSSYLKDDIKTIINKISNIKIDWKKINDLLSEKWENISISFLNVFIPTSKYNLLHYIWNSINKKILKIIPSEFSLIHLFEEINDLVIIDLWNSHTSIIIKKDWNLIWVSKISVWIDDLIKKIKENRNISKIDAINSIDDDIFSEEKAEFLEIFEECVITWLEEILKKDLCPNNFFITWWWWNDFIKNHFKNANLNKKNLKILRKLHLLEFDEHFYATWNKKIMLNMISMAKVIPILIK